LIEAEAGDVLSDDTIVDKLRESGIDIARRTVANTARRCASLVGATAREKQVFRSPDRSCVAAGAVSHHVDAAPADA